MNNQVGIVVVYSTIRKTNGSIIGACALDITRKGALPRIFSFLILHRADGAE